jgi:soluble cytochrome b562
MVWFKKKTEEKINEDIPRLPELPNSEDLVFPSKEEFQPIPQDIPENMPEVETRELPMLPDFESEEIPGPNKTRPIANSAVPLQKSRFAPLQSNMQKQPGNMGAMNITREIRPEIKYRPKTFEMSSRVANEFSKPVSKEVEPVYIRLDKFETTVQAFEEIKNKIIEIESVLKKTQEIKQKEEKELEDWEREIQIIKARIDSIDKNVFNKLD